MTHVHDHAAMVDNTTATTIIMNHDHHMMDHSTETGAMANGHGLGMMMMAVSIEKKKLLFACV
jgi:hypothetical protein